MFVVYEYDPLGMDKSAALNGKYRKKYSYVQALVFILQRRLSNIFSLGPMVNPITLRKALS